MNRLKAVYVNPIDFAKLDFVLQKDNGQTVKMTLREQVDWPIILGQPYYQVEKWLFETYPDLVKMALL